jgi:putative transposase
MEWLWRQARLHSLCKRLGRRVVSTRPRSQAPSRMSQVSAIDGVLDALVNGQKLKWLTVAEGFSRDGLAIDVAGAFRSRHVIVYLSRFLSERVAPMFFRSDNGP